MANENSGANRGGEGASDKNYYKTILKNALQINPKDPSLNTKLRKSKASFDVLSRFGREAARSVLEKKNFSFEVKEDSSADFAQAVLEAQDGQEVIDLHYRYDRTLREVDKRLLLEKAKFSLAKRKILAAISEGNNKFLSDWKRIELLISGIISQKGINPFHFATCFVSWDAYCAPMLLREARLRIDSERGRVFVDAQGEWFLNEKLMAVLADRGYLISEETFNAIPEKADLASCVEFLGNQLKIR